MTEPRTAPYGTWSSPIGADLLATAGVGLMEPWLEDGIAYWLEGRPAEGGRYVVVRGDPWSSPDDVTPPGFNVRTKVHEYGGGSYLVHRGTVYFSNFADQRLYRQAEGADPEPITPDTSGRHRYADGRVTPDGSRLLCVRERHEDDGVVNELVAVPLEGGDVRTIAGGKDFYSAPRIAPDGTKLAWLSWDLPWMPWDGCELWVGDLGADGEVSNARRVAGTDGAEAIVQPEWSPSGALHFVSDRSRVVEPVPGGRGLGHPAARRRRWSSHDRCGSSAPRTSPSSTTDGSPASSSVTASGISGSSTRSRGSCSTWTSPTRRSTTRGCTCEGSQLVFIGGGPTIPMQVVSLDFASRGVEVLRESLSVDIDPSLFSTPRTIEFPTEGGSPRSRITTRRPTRRSSRPTENGRP